MRKIKFRPLRRIKKTGKICVASYIQWNNIMTADYDIFNLTVVDEYSTMPKDEFVYNHLGELLYFFYFDPNDIQIFDSYKENDPERLVNNHYHYGLNHGEDHHINYNVRGTDCYGVPVFSHMTADYIGTHYSDPFQFTPLTVEMVVKWLSWLMFRLKRTKIERIIIQSL